MCGRYTIIEAKLIAAALGVIASVDLKEFIEHQRYNVAPSQLLPIVHLGPAGERVISIAKWGLIPSWTKGEPKTKPINGRAA